MNGILIDEYGDIIVANGSMSIGDVDEQIVQFVMAGVPGDFKESPTLGVNVQCMLGGNVDTLFQGRIKEQIKSQHLKVIKVTVSETEIYVEV